MDKDDIMFSWSLKGLRALTVTRSDRYRNESDDTEQDEPDIDENAWFAEDGPDNDRFPDEKPKEGIRRVKRSDLTVKEQMDYFSMWTGRIRSQIN